MERSELKRGEWYITDRSNPHTYKNFYLYIADTLKYKSGDNIVGAEAILVYREDKQLNYEFKIKDSLLDSSVLIKSNEKQREFALKKLMELIFNAQDR